MYAKDLKVLGQLFHIDKTFEKIRFVFLNNKTISEYQNSIKHDFVMLEEFYWQIFINALTVKAYLEADNKKELITPIKNDIQLLHEFATRFFSIYNLIEQMAAREQEVCEQFNWSSPLSEHEISIIDGKQSIPFTFATHYAHLSYISDKAIFYNMAMDNGLLLNKFKQIVEECGDTINDYLQYLSEPVRIRCEDHLNEKINNYDSKMETGYFLYREKINFEEIDIKTTIPNKVVNNERYCI